MSEFHVGDVVRVRTADEIQRLNGYSIKPFCAITCYADTIAEIVAINADTYTLKAIELVEHYDPDEHHIHTIGFYGWHARSLDAFDKSALHDDNLAEMLSEILNEV